MSDEVMVKLEHARRVGYCARGMRRWFEGREHTWQEFITTGLPASWARATGDAMAMRLADEAEREAMTWVKEEVVHNTR